MIDYLYYKIYRLSKKSKLQDVAEYMAAAYLATLISINILTLSSLLSKLDILPFIFNNKYQAGGFFLAMILASWFYFVRNNRYNTIFEKYSSETIKEKIKGNISVIIYVVISFAFSILGALFKPGYLPSF